MLKKFIIDKSENIDEIVEKLTKQLKNEKEGKPYTCLSVRNKEEREVALFIAFRYGIGSNSYKDILLEEIENIVEKRKPDYMFFDLTYLETNLYKSDLELLKNIVEDNKSRGITTYIVKPERPKDQLGFHLRNDGMKDFLIQNYKDIIN